MNIASLQALAGNNMQTSTNNMQSGQPVSSSFGSVFSSIAGKVPLVVVTVKEETGGEISDEAIMELFNATSLEELKAAITSLKENGTRDLDSEVDSISSLGDLEEIASLLDLDPKQLIESLLPLLQEAGLDEDELSVVANTNDFWTVLNVIDKVAPQFFKQLTDALEGKGEIPKKQAVELLTLLKTAELVAPKTDLLMKQEQQVFTLQGSLATAAKHCENLLISSNSAKSSMVQWMESKNIGRFVVQADTGRTMTDDGPMKNGLEPSLLVKGIKEIQQQPVLSAVVTVMEEETVKNSSEPSSTTANSKEPLQQAVSSALGTVLAVKGEQTLAELENRNNSRNETLIKEMQNIFKRSNFGQTGGTNRLLVKLYPEHLGQVRIELLQINGVMTARILASTALGKEMLDSQLHQLRSAFLQQNLQVERIDISQTLQDISKNEREQAFNQHFRKEGQDTEEQHEQNDEEEMTFQEYMIELEA
ncbi:flagellar hook-length control protein FliK [Sporosarcina sp. FSL K6-1508]|uniref:flagellar hook-length control protein FliK n=1 Tax=Sporosarcina sp. FSL K6-1508 TaxID=2921553 RepID=UPI0030FBBA96